MNVKVKRERNENVACSSKLKFVAVEDSQNRKNDNADKQTSDSKNKDDKQFSNYAPQPCGIICYGGQVVILVFAHILPTV